MNLLEPYTFRHDTLGHSITILAPDMNKAYYQLIDIVDLGDFINWSIISQ